MCIGLPLRVVEAWAGGALAAGRGQCVRVDTSLVGDVAAGDWLLVFAGAARERLAPERAHEIDAALALLDAAMSGDAEGAGADPGFALPSAMSAESLAALTGQTSAPSPESGENR